MFKSSSKRMSSNIKTSTVAGFLLLTPSVALSEGAEERIIKQEIAGAGFRRASELYNNPDEKLASVGRVFFESSQGLSLNGNISCRTCHQDKFGSADGIPNAAAIGGGEEVGPSRLLSGAKQLPRNTLPFWGRGGNFFDTFFWDGKVDFSGERKLSQFGENRPSNDPLVVAVHLPVVEIREMLDEDDFVKEHKLESVDKAKEVYSAIAKQLQRVEANASQELGKCLGKNSDKLTFLDYARAIAAFIRSEFRIKETKLERIMTGSDSFSVQELLGAKLFYGKGACVTCHSGPYFSDFQFHTIPLPQLGFGKNGFGMDFGRYNVTFDPKDLYKFRTPPLYNVDKTGPYGHSGSVATVEEAVIAHFDPLSLNPPNNLSAFDRYEFAKRLTYSDSTTIVNYLNREEVRQIVEFLRTLSF